MKIFKNKKVKPQQEDIDFSRLPKHLAFIMDGNGRWAKSRGLPRSLGHKEGVNALKRVINACLNYNIKYVSFFAFSTENWNRPKAEVDYLFNLINEYADNMSDDLERKGIKIVTMGDISKIPTSAQEALERIKAKSANGNKMIVNIGINYGGRDEILRAVNNIIKDKLTHVDLDTFKSYLYTADLPDPDMVVRTSGEQRVSNFMLFEMAYSEFYFPLKHWPDFDAEMVKNVIIEYQKRNRRFGAIKEE